MMFADREPVARERVKAVIGTVALQGVLGYLLVTGLFVKAPEVVREQIKLFEIAAKSPPPVVEVLPPSVASNKPEGETAPPNFKAKPTQVVAPLTIQPLVLPPIVAASFAGAGSDASAGGADIAGPGSGSGGMGNGSGSGGSGNGEGSGYARWTPPRWLRGRLKDSDYPDQAGEAGVGGTVSVRYKVAETGRVTACEVTRSSGNAGLNETTCRLIMKRFRFKPSLNAEGRVTTALVTENHTWVPLNSRDSLDDTRSERGGS